MESQDAKDALERCLRYNNKAELRVVIHQPGGIGRTPTVAVKAIHAGFDWDKNTILIYLEEQLSRLTSDEVETITKSVSKGESWHSEQQLKKDRQRLKEITEKKRNLMQLLEARLGAKGTDEISSWQSSVLELLPSAENKPC